MSSPGSANRVAVVVPTRNRPPKLRRCLEALAAARNEIAFSVYVGDSSTTRDVRREVEQVCTGFDFVRFVHHGREGLAAARNECTKMAPAEVLINVDDDVYVERPTIRRLVDRYDEGEGWRVVGGSVNWHGEYSAPVVMRRIGYGRKARIDEDPSFLIGALYLYPRELGLRLPWNEGVPSSDDRWAGAVWRSKGVHLLFAPDANATHDEEDNRGGGIYGVDHQAAHIYVNLFDALLANRDIPRALGYEVLGFLAGLKRFGRSAGGARRFVSAWWRGHRALKRDWPDLKAVTSAELPPPPGAPSA